MAQPHANMAQLQSFRKQAKDGLTSLKLPKRKRCPFLKHGATQKYLAPSGVYIYILFIYVFVENIGNHKTCMTHFQLVKWTSRVLEMQNLFILPETKVAPKMDGWNTNFLSGFRIFQELC